MKSFVTAAAALALIASSTALARSADDDLIGVTRAVAVAERALSARAFDAELETSSGRLVYEVELVRNGTLHEAHVDARSGRLIRAIRPRAEGQWRKWFDAERLRKAERARPLATTLTTLERQAHGRVQQVELEVEHGAAWYEIEIATPAGVADIRVDPETGRRLAMAYDD